MIFPEDVLVFDTENATFGQNVSEPEKHTLRLFGAYSYKFNKYYILQDRTQIQKLINLHKFLVGFNNLSYDNKVLEVNHISLKYKIGIDLMRIVKQRMGSIMWKGQPLTYQLDSFSLDIITKTLNLADETTGKGEIDYKILDKHPSEWSSDEIKDIYKYLKRDIELTKKLWEFIFMQFDSWKYHLKDEDQKRLRHITVAPSVYTYKVICNKTGLEEEYGERINRGDEGDNEELHDGAFVSYPSGERFDERELNCKIKSFDFASLYPHVFIQCNLSARTQNPEDWHGDNKFKVLGYYDKAEMCKNSKALWEIYKERKQLKKLKDEREYGLKITMNTYYGCSRNSAFKNIYDPVGGNDCCLLAQQFIKLARNKFIENGYNVIYSDTDSIYLVDHLNDEERLNNIRKDIIINIQKYLPFPAETFDLAKEHNIEFMHFFHGGNEKDDEELDEYDKQNKRLGLMKKNYIYVFNDNGKRGFIIKNLGIVKRSNTKLSKKIFWEKMVPTIMEEHRCKFEKDEISKWINEYLQSNLKLITKRFNVDEKHLYKSKTCTQVQIYDYTPKNQTNNLGSGIHFLIPNKVLGIGKGDRKYCTMEEYTQFLTYKDLDLDVVFDELLYFTKDAQIKNTPNNSQNGLSKWFN